MLSTNKVNPNVESEDPSSNGRELFKTAISYRNFGNRSVGHQIICKTKEWFGGKFNISVCDLLIDAGFALKNNNIEQANQLLEAAVHMMNIWKHDELLLGGYVTAKPDEKIKTKHGIITLSKLHKLVSLASKEVCRLLESNFEDVKDDTQKNAAFGAIIKAINEVAPNDARKNEKLALNDGI
jgi:hypothetical protein